MKEFIEQLIAHLKTQKGWCSSRTCEAVTDEIRKFTEEYKPRTNADRIRSMDDAELARILRELDCRHCSFAKDCCIGKSCRDGALEWLQSEAKE